ncbi:MAG: hypothetical protein JNL34_05975 [Anaerolineae bacterium]|nr:hypothetical protein [Anaerolineae bacterium]
MLKITLLADAIFEVVCAVVCFVVAIGLDTLNWGSQRMLFITLGVAFLGAAILLVWLAFRPQRALIWLVIVLNAAGAFAAFMLALIFLGIQPLQVVVYVALAGVILLLLSILEFIGLRRLPAQTP